MNSKKKFRQIFKELSIFSLPFIAGQIGQMLFGIGDMIVAGRYSNEAVSALGISAAIFVPFLMFGFGVTYAIGALVSQKQSTTDFSKNESSFLASSLFSSIITSIPLILLLLVLIKYFLPYFNLTINIEEKVSIYLYICSYSIFPALLFQSLKEFLQAYNKTYFANISILFFNIVNIVLNAVLMFGYGPIPELGIEGAALATLLNQFLMAIVLLIYTSKYFKLKLNYNINYLKEIMNMGIPIGISTLSEILIFSLVTILVGKISILASASHNIVLNLSSLTFMVPLAISSAIAIKIGTFHGEKDLYYIQHYSKAAISLSILIMTITAVFYLTIPNTILNYATSDKPLLDYSSKLLFFVGIFQIPDGIQITFLGILRGMGITKTPMFMNILINWGIGFPLGHYLAIEKKMEASGYWIGLSTGLILMAIGLAIFYKLEIRKIEYNFLKE